MRVRAKADHFRALLDHVDEQGQSIGVDPLDEQERQRKAKAAVAATADRRRQATLLQCIRAYPHA